MNKIRAQVCLEFVEDDKQATRVLHKIIHAMCQDDKRVKILDDQHHDEGGHKRVIYLTIGW